MGVGGVAQLAAPQYSPGLAVRRGRRVRARHRAGAGRVRARSCTCVTCTGATRAGYRWTRCSRRPRDRAAAPGDYPGGGPQRPDYQRLLPGTPGAGGHLHLAAAALFVLALPITLLKGKIWTGLLGLFVPVLFILGAARLARPGSPWARWRYAGRPNSPGPPQGTAPPAAGDPGEDPTSGRSRAWDYQPALTAWERRDAARGGNRGRWPIRAGKRGRRWTMPSDLVRHYFVGYRRLWGLIRRQAADARPAGGAAAGVRPAPGRTGRADRLRTGDRRWLVAQLPGADPKTARLGHFAVTARLFPTRARGRGRGRPEVRAGRARRWRAHLDDPGQPGG